MSGVCSSHQIRKAVAELGARSLLDVSEDSVCEEMERLRQERRQRKLEKANNTTSTAGAPPDTADSDEEVGVGPGGENRVTARGGSMLPPPPLV